jgi:type II secretory pathway pseudopilin PulG
MRSASTFSIGPFNTVKHETHHPKKQGKRHSLLTAGFSLIELIVAIGIFIVLTSVLLFNYNKFGNRLTLDILSHQIAGWIRDAQVSAMSVRIDRTGAGKYPGYGVHFDATPADAFIYFADTYAPDKQYNAVSGACGAALAECEKQIKILQKNRVELICGAATTPTKPQGRCPVGFEELLAADIVFIRPNPDANIIGRYLPASPVATTSYSHVNITIVTPIGYRRTIGAWTTGQIYVQ